MSTPQKIQAELDSTTKNIVQEILRECSNKNIHANEPFVTYYVRLLMLNPGWGITTENLPNRNNVQSFVKYCVKQLGTQGDPSLAVLKMQFYFLDHFDDLTKLVESNKEILNRRLEPLEKEILETDARDFQPEKLLKKMLYWIILKSGLGNPTESTILEESQAALRSIYTSGDLVEFADMSTERKRIQMLELTQLVAGIRLFNKDCGKGGAGIEDLQSMLLEAIKVTKDDIQRNLNVLADINNILTTAVENSYRIYEDKKFNYVLKWEIPEGVSEKDIDDVKEMLIIYRQYELYVRKIEIEVNRLENKAKDTFNNFTDALEKLQKTVEFRIAIPTVHVFPHFEKVFAIWTKIQDKTILLSQISKVLMNLQSYVKNLQGTVAVGKMVGPGGPITDSQRLERSLPYKIEPSNEFEVLDPSSIGDFEKVTLQYLGFCAWTFVETFGGLIPGFPNMGIVKYKNMMFVFSSPEAASAFRYDPCKYILRGLQIARLKPELINLLQLKEQVVAVHEIDSLVVEEPEEKEICNVGTMTELHPIETNIDPNYMSNIWDWKRQALMLANISKCITHSTQTKVSRAWNSVGTQTYENRQKICQTKKDNYSNVPTLANFLYGLRGQKDDKYHILTLTRPVDEQKEDDWVGNKNFYYK